MTVEENIRLAGRLAGTPIPDKRIRELLDAVELPQIEKRKPSDLSGGQQQRVAIARALAVDPDVIFADEPTGSLDEKSSDTVISLLKKVSDSGVSVIMVTHDPAAAAAADRVCILRDGDIDQILESSTAENITAATFGAPVGAASEQRSR